MSNSKKIASIAFTGAAVTATTTFMAVYPAAAATCIVRNQGVCYGGPLKAKVKTGTTTVLVDKTKNTTLTCKKATFSGTIGNDIGPNIGVISKATWSSCTGPFGLTFKAHLTTKANIIVAGGNATSATGKLSGNKISGEISGTGLMTACHATISGSSIPWKYDNAAHSFNFNPGHVPTLHVKAQANCLGALNVSDTAYFAGIYHVSVPADLTIS